MHPLRPRFPLLVRPRCRRLPDFVGTAIALAIHFVAGLGSAQPPAPASLAQSASATVATDLFFVELSGRSSAAAWRKAGGRNRPGGGMIPALAAATARRQAAANRAEQANLRAALAPLGAVEVHPLHRILNGIVVRFDPARLDELARLPGVVRIVPVDTVYPANSSAVPWTRVEQIWKSPLGLHGDGIRIGIIDTGIDYQHSHFGGTGLQADYLANDRTVISEGGGAAFPTAKVAGGWDFVGDAYSGGASPMPDPDPMDCHGHGTHVAGIAAGFGVNVNGTTYSGPYDETIPFDLMRIGPGVAPRALLYSLRVFGCTGGTNFVAAALEWSMDPNGDDDLSDHLDVVNLSIGSPFATAAHLTGIAADEAVAAGVAVVCSAGNSGDTYYITGAPGTGERTVSVASIADPGSYPQPVLRVDAPVGVAGDYTASRAAFAPDPLGQYGQIALVNDGAGASVTDGCETIVNDVAGKIAMLDRGNCTFVVKATNAQAAGAMGVVVVNHVAGGVPGLGGTSSVIDIPVLGISLADGNSLKTAMGSATVTASMLLLGGGVPDTIASDSSRGSRAGPFPPLLKPDVSAPGLDIVSAATGIVAGGTNPNNRATTISGTSMSSPHVAGLMALLRERNPFWTVAELKAALINGAIHDITTLPANGSAAVGPGRVGAGRVDAEVSAEAEVIAFDADNPDAVSIAMVLLPTTLSTEDRTVRVVNKGIGEHTYEVAIETRVDAPGIAFSLPGGPSATVAPLGTTDLIVRATADPAQMDHAREASVSDSQAGRPRHWLTEEGAYVTFRQGGTLRFRLPLLAAARPASAMTGGAVITGGAVSGSTTIELTGTGVCTGLLGPGPVCTGSFPTDVVSLVTPLELQASSPRDPGIEATFDIRHVGVAYDPTFDVVMFGVSMWGDWSTPTDIRVEIEIDTNEDGTWDRTLVNSTAGFVDATGGDDVFVSRVLPSAFLPLNRASPAALDTAPFLNRTMLPVASPSSLGLTGGDTNFRYRVRTLRGLSDGTVFDTVAGPLAWDLAAQGLDFGGAHLVQALDGASIPVTWNEANLAANGSEGALLLFHHNTGDSSSQAVPLLVPVGLGGFEID